MFNFALIAQILDIVGESPETRDEVMEDLAKVVRDKFVNEFIIYLGERVEQDYQLEQFKKLVENADNFDEQKFNEYKKWLDSNIQVDLDEFWDNFEVEMKAMEMRIINEIKEDLTDDQKDQMLSFMDAQNEYIKAAYDQVDESITSRHD